MRLLAGKLRSFVGRKVGTGGDEEPRLDHQKIRKKNRKLKKLQEQVTQKDQELAKLRMELAESKKIWRLPTFFDISAPVFFIVGQGKSGTTWLMNTLNAHPEILCRGEGRFFERDFVQAAPLEDLQGERLKNIQPSSLYGAISSSEHLTTWIERSVWTDGEDVDEHLSNLSRLAVNYFLTQRLSKTGKRIVGDKTTFSSGEILYEIGTLYPEARVIHIIRDGRDVAVSMIHHMWNYSKDRSAFYALEPEDLKKRDAYREDPASALAEGLFTEKRLTDIAWRWATQVDKAMEYGPALFGEDYAEIRYEELVESTEEEVGKVLGFLGADASEETVRRCVEMNRFERWTEGRERGEEESSSFYRKGVAGDWQNVFTEDDKRTFKKVAGETLLRLGYEDNNGW